MLTHLWEKWRCSSGHQVQLPLRGERVAAIAGEPAAKPSPYSCVSMPDSCVSMPDSCVSMPDRSAPRPVEAGHRRPDSSYCIVGYEGVRKRYEATADYVSSMIHSKFFTESNWAKDSFQRLRCWISRTICTASRSMGGTT